VHGGAAEAAEVIDVFALGAHDIALDDAQLVASAAWSWS
jgi:hypothetical protein